MKEIIMVTGNKGKWKVASDIFLNYKISLKNEKLDTPEIQSHKVEDVSLYSALWASEKLGKPVIKSDVGYYIEALNGFPGPFLRYINDMLSSEEILKIMENKKNRKIILKECLTYAEPNGFYKQFVSAEEATISIKSEGEGSTFDKIVIFKGENHPKSLNSPEENYEHFKKKLIIYHDMAKFLETKEG